MRVKHIAESLGPSGKSKKTCTKGREEYKTKGLSEG